MDRSTVKHVAKLVPCNPATVRRIADKGYIEEVRRDYNGWRIFSNAERAAEKIRQLLLGETTSEELRKPLSD